MIEEVEKGSGSGETGKTAEQEWTSETDLCDAVLLSEVRVKSILRSR